MTSFYCQHCDKNMNNKFKQKHMKSKMHLFMYKNVVINKYNIGDIPFSDFENIIQKNIIDYNKKFNLFSILFKCNFNQEDIFISINNKMNYVFLYKFKDIGPIYYNYYQSKKARDYIYYHFFKKNIKLDNNSIINNLTITIFSEYKNMNSKHRFQQNRSVLESELLKRISNLDFADKITKYNYLSSKNELF